MKLLFDQNLSSRLPRELAETYPGSIHLRELGFQRASDTEIWTLAEIRGLTIVSKDSDFRQRSFLRGAPPKVVWLRVGNASTRDIVALLCQRAPELHQFHQDPAAAFLVVDWVVG